LLCSTFPLSEFELSVPIKESIESNCVRLCTRSCCFCVVIMLKNVKLEIYFILREGFFCDIAGCYVACVLIKEFEQYGFFVSLSGFVLLFWRN